MTHPVSLYDGYKKKSMKTVSTLSLVLQFPHQPDQLPVWPTRRNSNDLPLLYPFAQETTTPHTKAAVVPLRVPSQPGEGKKIAAHREY